MNQLRTFIIEAGSRLPLGITLAIYILTTVFWGATLSVIEAQFAGLTNGGQMLDVQTFFTPEPIVEQTTAYSPAVRALMWDFFILDNLLPQLVFGSYAILWAALWVRDDNPVYRWLRSGWWVLMPLGVGVWDWVENILMLPYIQGVSSPMNDVALWGAVAAHNLKIICVIPSALATYVFLGWFVISKLIRRFQTMRSSARQVS